MIGIIDYQMGNLRSVQKAFEFVGTSAVILTDAAQVAGVDRLVLPGVGAFGDGMERLRKGGWIDALGSFIQTGRPFLGICIGMQVLFDSSQEDAPSPDEPVAGLKILSGPVTRFQCDRPEAGRLKVPHMGWNTITWTRPDPLLAGLDQESAVYFVHSYRAESADEQVRSATCDYGGPFCASLWKDNIWATQFHPEKSQKVGLKMLANFTAIK